MKTAFPCNIPAEKPGHASKELSSAWSVMYETLQNRFSKLRKVAAILTEDEDKVAFALRCAYTDEKNQLRYDEYGEMMLDVQPATEIAEHIRGLMGIIQWQPFVRFPNAIEVVNCWFITVEEWQLIRCMGFGGSDAAITVGIYKYESSSPFVLATNKINLPVKNNDAGKAFIFDFGHIKEPQVIQRFCDEYDAEQLVCPFLFRHKNYPWMTANIDAICRLKKTGELVVFEAKTSGGQNWDEWRRGVPVQYSRQPVQYMAVLDDDRIIGAYIGVILANTKESWFCHFIPRRRDVEEELISAEEEFFKSYIEPGILPDPINDVKKDLFSWFLGDRKDQIQAAKETEYVDNPPEDVVDKLLTVAAAKRELEQITRRQAALEDIIQAGALDLFRDAPDRGVKKIIFRLQDGRTVTVGCVVKKMQTVDKGVLKNQFPEVYEELVDKSLAKILAEKYPEAAEVCVSSHTTVSAPSIRVKAAAPAPKGKGGGV